MNVCRVEKWAVVLALGLLGAGVAEKLEVTGKVLYGRAQGATTGAVVDHEAVFDQNPIDMYRRAQGLSLDDAEGMALFGKAQAVWKKALAKVADSEAVDVITVPGGVHGGDVPIRDLTLAVIDLLPRFYVHGKVLNGRAASAQNIAELDEQEVLDAIPAYREFLTLTEDDARYHLLKKQYSEAFGKALRKASRDNDHDCVAVKGGVTSRLGYVPDLTQAAISALDS